MSHVTQRVVSKDILQDLALLSASGNGKVGGVEMTRKVRSAIALELWVDVTAVTAGFAGSFILESRLEGSVGWFEIARISLTDIAIGTPPKAYASGDVMSRGGKALGEEVRGRYEISSGTVTAKMMVVRRE